MIKVAMIKYINCNFKLSTNQEFAFGFLYNLYRLQEMSQETLKCHCINLHLNLNSDWHETSRFEELILFRIVPQESSALDILNLNFKIIY